MTIDLQLILTLVLSFATIVGVFLTIRVQNSQSIKTLSDAARDWRAPLQEEIARLRDRLDDEMRRSDAMERRMYQMELGINVLIRQLTKLGVDPEWRPGMEEE